MRNEIALMTKSKLFAGITKEECRALHQMLQPSMRKFRKDQIVVNEREPVKHIGIVATGAVASHKFYYQGDSHLIQIYGPGDAFGIEWAFSSLGTYSVTLVALQDTEILTIPQAMLVSKLNDGPIGRIINDNVIKELADETVRKTYKLEVLSKKSLHERIKIFLFIIRDKTGSDCFHIGMNQQQFAQYLCVNRSTLSYELNEMRRNGEISFEKDFFTIHNL